MSNHYNVLNNSGKLFTITEKSVLCILVLTSLLFLGITNVDIFHSTVEIIGVVLGGCIFLISLLTYDITIDIKFNFFGITYGFFTFFELMQALYPADSILSLQLSICARLFQCFFILIIFYNFSIKTNVKGIFYIYLVASILLLCSIFLWHTFPSVSLVKGIFSSFYTAISYITILVYLTGIIFLLEDRCRGTVKVCRLLFSYFVLVVAYQSSILINIPNTQFHIILIHMIKLLCSYPILILVNDLAFRNPLQLFFMDLNTKTKELEKKEVLLQEQNKELKSANEALLRANSLIMSSHDKYTRLLQSLPNAVILLKEHTVMFFNNNFQKMFESAMEKDILNNDIFEMLKPPYRKRLEMDISYVYEGNNIKGKQERLMLGDKEIDLEYTILFNRLDGEKYALLLFEDISEKKQAQEILNKAKLEEENERLKVGFLANISHELRTPINIIYSALQLEDKYMSTGKDLDIEKYNKVIKQNCFRLLRIINNLIDATKIDASFFKPNMRNMNIVSVIEDATLSVVPFVESKSMTLTFDTDVEEKYMLFDPDLIERIVLNLLANSVKYGVFEGKIWVNIKDCGDSIKIHFKDNGIGIPKDKRELIFNRFMRIDHSFSRNAEGSGIGLYLVRRFVEMHNGSIHLTSEEGSGTEFCIVLPCIKPEENHVEILSVPALDMSERPNIIDKVNIEFSDIYIE